MEIKASYVSLMGGIEATRGDAILGILKERGRGFASDSETWAVLKASVEDLKKQQTDIEKVHKEMWDAVKLREPDAFAALLQQFERSAATIAGEWVRASVMAKIALEDPALPEEPTMEEKLEADVAQLAKTEEMIAGIEEVLPYAEHLCVAKKLSIEMDDLKRERTVLKARIAAAGERTCDRE